VPNLSSPPPSTLAGPLPKAHRTSPHRRRRPTSALSIYPKPITAQPQTTAHSVGQVSVSTGGSEMVSAKASGLNSWSSSWNHCMADLRWRAAAAQGERDLGEVCKKDSEAGAEGRSRYRRLSLAPSAHYAFGCGALRAGGVGVSMPPQERGTAAMTRPAPFVSASAKGRTHGSSRLHGMRGLWREFRGGAWTSDRNRGSQRGVVSKSVRAIGDRIPRAFLLGRVIAAPLGDRPLVG
jgi:hypothetical protein